MIHRFRWFRKLAPVGFCFVVLSSVLFAGQKTPEVQATNIPSDIDAPVVANNLFLAFHDRSLLTRFDLLEQLDASPAVDQPSTVSLLQDSLHDEDQMVREAALRALIRRDTAENPLLTEADLASFQGENAELAKVHFAAKNQDTAKLRELIQSGDAVVQEGAFDALAAHDTAGAVEVLRAELRDKTSLYRLQTLDLLTRSAYTNSPAELLPILRETATDHDPLVRDYANRLLKENTSGAEASQTQ